MRGMGFADVKKNATTTIRKVSEGDEEGGKEGDKYGDTETASNPY